MTPEQRQRMAESLRRASRRFGIPHLARQAEAVGFVVDAETAEGLFAATERVQVGLTPVRRGRRRDWCATDEAKNYSDTEIAAIEDAALPSIL